MQQEGRTVEQVEGAEQAGGIAHGEEQIEVQAEEQEGDSRAVWGRGADKEQRSNQSSRKGV